MILLFYKFLHFSLDFLDRWYCFDVRLKLNGGKFTIKTIECKSKWSKLIFKKNYLKTQQYHHCTPVRIDSIPTFHSDVWKWHSKKRSIKTFFWIFPSRFYFWIIQGGNNFEYTVYMRCKGQFHHHFFPQLFHFFSMWFFKSINWWKCTALHK